MGKTSIDTVKKYTEFLVRKNNSQYLSPDQFNLIINRASRTIFVKRTGNPHDYQVGAPVPRMGFQITQKITEDLKRFQETANLVLSAQGRVTYPSNLAYTIPGIFYKTQKQGNDRFVEVEIIDKDKEGYRLGSAIMFPTRLRPIAVFESTYLQVYPTGISNIKFPYLRYPIDAVWAYTVVNNRPVFDPVNSVDLEWEDMVINDIIMQALKSIGISIKDADVMNFANSESTQGA